MQNWSAASNLGGKVTTAKETVFESESGVGSGTKNQPLAHPYIPTTRLVSVPAERTEASVLA